MRAPRLIPILILAALFSLAEASAADKIDGFAKLTSADTLQMRFTSGGCFHFFTYDLTFTRTNKPTVSIAAIRLELEGPDPGAHYRDAERRELGTLPLSERDLAGLDALLAFYRTNNTGGCTTHDGVKISQIRNDKVITTENFIDASCKLSGGNVKGVLTIDSLVRRLGEVKPQMNADERR